MQLSKYLFVASLSVLACNVSGLIASPPGLHPNFQRSLDSRAGVVPIKNPRPGSEPNSPKPKEGENAGSRDSTPESTESGRRQRIQDDSYMTTDPGMKQVLLPSEYMSKGQTALEQSRDLIRAYPRVDKEFPSYSERYERVYDFKVEDGNPTSGTNALEDIPDLAEIFKGMGIDGNKRWSEFGYASKGTLITAEVKPEEVQLVAYMNIDKNSGTVLGLEVSSQADIDPIAIGNGPVPRRLFSSELVALSYREVAGSLDSMKNFLQWPVKNLGTQKTIADAFRAKGVKDEDRDAGEMIEVWPGEIPGKLLNDPFSGLAGTDNARPGVRLTGDYPDSSKGLEVVKIQAWYRVKGAEDKRASALNLVYGRAEVVPGLQGLQ